MSQVKVKSKRKHRWRRLILILLLLLAAIAYVTFILLPDLRAQATTTYDSYTATLGSISNSLSFSGSISVTNYETLSASGEGTVRQIYVTEEQEVKEGDKLLRLSTGETLKANFDGNVNEISVDLGDSVTANDGLIQIVDFQNMSVSIRVDEYAIAEISVGQACRVTVTALDVTFDSSITHINRIPANSGSTAYYTVTAEFVATDNVLPGMQVTVEIPQEEADNAVILNKSALSFGRDNSAYVLKQNESGEMEQTAVEIGVDNDSYVQILSGVSEGETVYAVAQSSGSSATGLAALFSGMGGGGQMPAGGMGDMGGGQMPSNMGGGQMPGNMGGGQMPGNMGGGMGGGMR